MQVSRWVVVIVVLAATACASYPVPDLSGLPEAPADFPAMGLAGRVAGKVYIASDSRLQVTVGREGSMSRLGHHHVLTAPVYGLFSIDGRRVKADLYTPVAAIVVDDPSLRAELGPDFATQLSAEDREATRGNLLSPKVLDALNHGFLRATIDGQHDSAGWIDVTLSMAGHSLPTRIRIDSGAAEPCRRLFTGAVTLRHDQFGLQPFEALGGALRVSNEMTVTIDLAGTPGSGC